MFAAGIAVGLILSVVAIVMALVALSAARARRPADADERVAALEERVRGLVYRVWKLEGGPGAGTPRESPAAPDVTPVVEAAPRRRRPGARRSGGASRRPWRRRARRRPRRRTAGSTSSSASARAGPPGSASSPSWSAVALFLKWAFDNAFLGPAARVALGLVAGLVMLGGGLLLHRRRDVPYLSEGLAGGGLGVLYLSLFAAHALYGLVGPTPAFVAMFAVTLLGTAVAVASSRLITAVLAVLGGLLTPVLLQVERPDERNLLAYLLVLDALVLLAARFRTWPSLNRLAWLGSALLVLPTLLREPEAPRPLARLLLLSALFLIFLAVPLFRERRGGAAGRPDRSGAGGRQRGGLLLGGLRHARGLAPLVGGALRARPGRALPARGGGLRLPGPRRPRHRGPARGRVLDLPHPRHAAGAGWPVGHARLGGPGRDAAVARLAVPGAGGGLGWAGGAPAGGGPRGRARRLLVGRASRRSGTWPSWFISWSWSPWPSGAGWAGGLWAWCGPGGRPRACGPRSGWPRWGRWPSSSGGSRPGTGRPSC